MTEVENIELARAYVALSNAHRVDLIRLLFARNAIYCSSAVGEFQGPLAIGDMMAGFFSRYPDVYWKCENYRCSANAVAFEFELEARDADSGEVLRRNGTETIAYSADGYIERLEVIATAASET